MHPTPRNGESAREPIAPVFLRFTAYTLVTFALTASLAPLARYYQFRFFAENGPIEWIQFGFLVSSSALFVVLSLLSPFRELALLLASLAAFAAVRELNGVLDPAIPRVGWKVAYVIVAWAGWFAFRHRSRLRRQIARFLTTPAFPVLWAGFIVAVPIAQYLGHGPFLESLLGTDYRRDYKQVIEESGELAGYFLILAGTFESLLQLKSVRLLEPANPGQDCPLQPG